MLRLLALVLLLANGGYYAWSNGYLLSFGVGPAQQNEPQRLRQQVLPQAVRVLSPAEFKRIEEQIKAEKEPSECLQAGPFDEAQAAVLRRALGDAFPPDSWRLDATETSARWIIYMGPFASAALLAKKRAEVNGLSIRTEDLANSALEPGFSLGGFDSKAAADAALSRLGTRVHSARVVQERAASVQYDLRLPSVRAALKPKVAELRSALDSKTLHACN